MVQLGHVPGLKGQLLARYVVGEHGLAQAGLQLWQDRLCNATVTVVQQAAGATAAAWDGGGV